jgi:hypothetical protein
MGDSKAVSSIDLLSRRQLESDFISLLDLSELSGYPIELLRKELSFTGDKITIRQLREKMMVLLNSTMENGV